MRIFSLSLIVAFIFSSFVMLSSLIDLVSCESSSPYQTLHLKDGTSMNKVRSKYKQLKMQAKGNKELQKIYKEAYEKIMLQDTLEMTLDDKDKRPSAKKSRNSRKNRKRRRGFPRLSDMFRPNYFGGGQDNQGVPRQRKQNYQIEDQQNYAEEQQLEQQSRRPYQLPPQYDDGSYDTGSNYKYQRQTQSELRNSTVDFNIRIASYILFFGGMLLKLTPCFILYCCYRYRRQQRRTLKPGQKPEPDVNPFARAANGWTGRSKKQHASNKNKKL